MKPHGRANGALDNSKQPPSGGCVLKQVIYVSGVVVDVAAAFGRLCVETNLI